MPDKLANTLKTWGLTPWQGIAGIAFVACWFTTLRPMPPAAQSTATGVSDRPIMVTTTLVTVCGKKRRITGMK